MIIPTTLSPSVVKQIADIGKKRAPAEACGVLLPAPWRDRLVWEMPNRSTTSHESFALKSDDIVIELGGWIESNPQLSTWDQITIWHTHPGGRVGPSKADMENRIEFCGNLVVSLTEPPLATWF